MTAIDPDVRAAAEADGFETELWTYAGRAPGSKVAQADVWYDADREPHRYAPDKGVRYVVGHVYRVLVKRPEMTKRTGGEFAGRHGDPDWVARLEAEAYAGDRAIAAAQVERRAARADGELTRLIAPLEAVAAGMSYAQRDALAALVTRRIYRAERKGT
jgi:hypothetical protein